jgi:hypothetical protein
MRSTTPAPSLEEQIRERAHQIWLREGRPEGRDIDHWRQAEVELAGGDQANAAERKRQRPRASAPKKAAARPATAKPIAMTTPRIPATPRPRRKDAAK